MAGNTHVNRLAASKQELREFNFPDFPEFPVEAVTGDPKRRQELIAQHNGNVLAWRRQVSELMQQWLLLLKQT